MKTSTPLLAPTAPWWSRSCRALAIGVLAAASLAVHAQDFPTKPIRLIVGFAPGGTADVVGRAVANRLSQELGQQVVVDNRGGAGGSIGADAVARAPADGYTLGLSNVSTHAVNPACNPKLTYDPIKDFTPLITLGTSANVILVHPTAIPAKSFPELVALLKSAPGKYTYATSGNCGVAHLLGEQIKALTGTYMVHIPYRGAGPALNDVLAGQVPIMVDNLVSALPSIQAGKLRPLAVAWPRRIEALQDTPTLAELGLPSANDPGWLGLVAPAALPPDVTRKLNEATRRALAHPELQRQMQFLGISVAGGTPEAHGQLIANEFRKMRELVATRKIQLQN